MNTNKKFYDIKLSVENKFLLQKQTETFGPFFYVILN